MNVELYIEKFLHDSKTGFNGVNSLGILRKDLVAVLGMERAKGFLLRYSWQCGANDAKYLRDNFSWDSEMEVLHAGYKVNHSKGLAIMIPLEVRADRKTGDFYFEGKYFYSCEADQHLQCFGRHTDPVCHTLVGYASGYATEYLGSEVVFKEIACIGRGDPNCIIIGKSLRDWGDQIDDLLSYFKQENLSDELDRAYQRIEAQKQMLGEVIHINERLSKTLIKGENISDVLAFLSQNLSSTVILEDRNFNLIESCGKDQPQPLQPCIENLKLKKSPWMHSLFKEKRTVHITVHGPSGETQERLMSPVLLDHEVWGYISFLKREGDFDEMERVLLERANTICALHFLNERTKMETERRIAGDFLNELLADHPNFKNLSYRMKLMGYDLSKEHYAYILSLNRTTESLNELKNPLIDLVNQSTPSIANRLLISTLLDKLIILVPAEVIMQTQSDPRQFGNHILSIFNQKYSHLQLSIGISSAFKGIEMFRKGYEEALKTVSIADRLGETSNVVSFGDLGYLGLIMHEDNIEHLKSFAWGLLKDVVAYDREYESELLKTLYFFLQFHGNVTQTSRRLMVSDGAVRYRLKRIEEFTNLDIINSKGFFEAHLALQILLFCGLWEIK